MQYLRLNFRAGNIKMVKVFLTAVLCAALVQSAAGQSSTPRYADILATIRNFGKQNGTTVDPFNRNDALGALVTLIDGLLAQTARGRPPPKSDMCNSRLMLLGENEVKISPQPRGYCSYCCRLIKPAKYVRLYFTNKASGGNTVELKKSRKPGALQSAGVDSNLPTVIFIHGFTEHGLGPSPRFIRDSYLSIDQDHNIILVDWGDLSPLPWYPQSVQNAKFVGAIVAKFIKFYNDTGELPISNLHLVGFSLGAHVAGFIGKFFQGPQKIPRITALDPAWPTYTMNDSSQRVAKTDAEFVDAIHTDAGILGVPFSLGHADFYPNGGRFVQPGCETGSLAEQKMVDQYVSCSHQRAWGFYAESVRNPKAFPATKCGIMREGSFKQCRFTTEAYMGFAANKRTTEGDFYLTTNNRKPFAKSAKEQEADMKTINLIL